VSIEDEVVRKAPLFTALDDAAAVSLRASMDSVKISKGGILFKEGDSGEHVYVIVEGKLKLGTSSGDGRENLLSILGPHGDAMEYRTINLSEPSGKMHTKILYRSEIVGKK
jgi:hypothetical protein